MAQYGQPENDVPRRNPATDAEYRPPEKLRVPWIFEDQIAANKRGTVWLLILFSLFITVIVWAAGVVLGSRDTAIIMAIVAALVTFGMSWYSYYHSDALVLQISRARPVSKAEVPVLINTLEGLAIAAGMTAIPKAYIIDDTAPNAFATGRDPEHAAVAVTTGLLHKLDRYQLEGVLAHEMSHIGNRDILLSTVAAIMVGTIVLVSDWVMRTMWLGGGRRRSSNREGGNPIVLIIAILALILAPLVAQLLRLAISRNREYLADANAVRLTRYPDGLIGALATIANDHEPLEVANKATAHIYIVNPLKDLEGGLNNLFRTHPPIDERIERLRRM